MDELGHMDEKLWKTTVFQHQVDEWRKDFYQWYKEEIKKKQKKGMGGVGELMFPKQKQRKKRMKHPDSILHKKENRTCFLCMKLHGDCRKLPYLEAHHVFGGANRKKSEEYGLKVYLCLEHHREGPEAVHRNHDMMRLVQQEGQRAFHLVYPEIDFRMEFGKNYLEEGEHE